MTAAEITAALSHARGLLSQLPNIGLHTVDALHEAERLCHEVEGLRGLCNAFGLLRPNALQPGRMRYRATWSLRPRGRIHVDGISEMILNYRGDEKPNAASV